MTEQGKQIFYTAAANENPGNVIKITKNERYFLVSTWDAMLVLGWRWAGREWIESVLLIWLYKDI